MLWAMTIKFSPPPLIFFKSKFVEKGYKKGVVWMGLLLNRCWKMQKDHTHEFDITCSQEFAWKFTDSG